MQRYKVLMHSHTFQSAKSYLHALQFETSSPGAILHRLLKNIDLPNLSIVPFVELLLQTKEPQIFAESAVIGDGSDWNLTELSILGDIGFAVPVIVFDNGLHHSPEIHSAPFSATLLYIPGALLQNGRGYMPADWKEVTKDGSLVFESYYNLYQRRLLPSFLYANELAGSRNTQAIITIPGLGCGLFAGIFKGQLGAELKKVLIDFMNQFSHRFPNIRAVYFDPYQECNNERYEINHISLFVRPLTKGNQHKPQLCRPQVYEDPGDNFSHCELFSFVAWDHVSWPGNDFYIGSRATDDGVKAAATNSMAVMTEIEGHYDGQTNTYNPPKPFGDWGDAVQQRGVQLKVSDNLLVLSS